MAIYHVFHDFQKVESLTDFFRESNLWKGHLLTKHIFAVEEVSYGEEVFFKAKYVSHAKDSVAYNIRLKVSFASFIYKVHLK